MKTGMRLVIGLMGLFIMLGFNQSAFAFSPEFGDTCPGLSSGELFDCFLTSDGNVHCYTVGLEYYLYSGGDAIGVSAGRTHFCILTSDGNVDCAGFDEGGETEDYYGGDAIGVSAGDGESCVLTSDGNVNCWGIFPYNYTGGDAIGISKGDWPHQPCILTSEGNVDCGLFDDRYLDYQYSGGDAIGVSKYWYGNVLVLTSEGNVHSPDYDYYGGDAIGVSTGINEACILKSDGNIDCLWGDITDYTGGDAIGVSVGNWSSCILTSGGNVYCEGQDVYAYTGGDAVCVPPTDPEISVTPLAYDFGNVAWMGDPQSTFINIANTGGQDLTVSGLSLVEPSGDFIVGTLESSVIAPDTSVDLEVSFAPTYLDYQEGTLQINSNDPDKPEMYIALSGVGVLADTSSEQVEAIIGYIDEAVETGDIWGVGTENSADRKIDVLKNMIEAYGDLIEDGLVPVEDACKQLSDIYVKVDGKDGPQDFIAGDATDDLRDVFEAMLSGTCGGLEVGAECYTDGQCLSGECDVPENVSHGTCVETLALP